MPVGDVAKAFVLSLRTLVNSWIAELRSPDLFGFWTHSDPAILDKMAAKTSSRLVVIGLGNFGSEWTRHSVGMQVVRRLAEKRGMTWTTQRKLQANVALDNQLILVEPRLFMNENGKAASAVMKQFLNSKKPKDGCASLIVVHDDLDRAFGNIRWKQRGSASGHNGVRSVIQQVGSDDFRRLQIGIGRPQARGAAIHSHVLGRFSPEEMQIIITPDSFLRQACEEI
eukprot:CAMPEP_0171556446 /NCGR_PEP_ID=MMETSP0960-20121227/10732_1 /TAXON_ID=87120 /ORGANISM="Aurantiochytrium limacinum, Strain ATCCMYA-1381" /LENGTH=225 /DNA_ID=CAMNT_0012106709 /DNA_START=94 /DNA_END=768 /DNA_ORIENTATION=-